MYKSDNSDVFWGQFDLLVVALGKMFELTGMQAIACKSRCEMHWLSLLGFFWSSCLD